MIMRMLRLISRFLLFDVSDHSELLLFVCCGNSEIIRGQAQMSK